MFNQSDFYCLNMLVKKKRLDLIPITFYHLFLYKIGNKNRILPKYSVDLLLIVNIKNHFCEVSIIIIS